MPPHVVSHSLTVDATPDRVWRALTDPSDLIQWYAPGCRWEIETLAVGASVRFFNSATDIQPATIELLLPESRLALRWRPDPEHPSATVLTTYEIDSAPDGTRVTLTHSGYESVPEGQRTEWLEADQGAVPAIVAALGAYVSACDTRSSVPPHS